MGAFRLSGGEELFEELVHRHTQRALAAARAMLGDESAAEDAVQECFLRLIRARATYEPGRPFFGWLITILRNVCRDELLRGKRRTKVEAEMKAAGLAAQDEAFAVDHEDRQSAMASLGNLPQVDREILTLRIHGGLDYSEIAVMCELSPDAVKKRAYRALDRLREQLLRTAARP